MKILWLCNIVLSKVADSMGINASPFGGWLNGLSNDLLTQDNLELIVLFPYKKENTFGKLDSIKYYGFSTKNNELQFTDIINIENPDIIHIFGTEYRHTLDMVNVCEKMHIIEKVIINIQGLVSYYGKYHYYADLTWKVVNSYTLIEFLRQDNIKRHRNKFIKRGEFEIEALQKVKNVVGRTDWDKACTTQVNSNLRYHFCNETLRSEFYNRSWSFDKCEKFSIFLSQGSYPIKGFHYMIEAMSQILKKYPLVHIYITGTSPFKLNLLNKLKQGSYSRYIGKLIKKYNLEDKVTFLGSLNEKEMCERYLKSHVFVSASSIENSPNSVGEAMILGVPTVSSDVGGVKNMLEHNKEGFVYQHNAPYMLAYYIGEIFSDDALAIRLSENAKTHASITHNREINLNTMMKIYGDIIKCE